MKHTDEKGHFAPAQSKSVRLTRNENPHLSGKTLGEMADKDYPVKGSTRRYGEHIVHGASGMARLAKLKEANKGKAAKSRVVLRGQKNERNKAYTKVGLRMHRKGLLKAPA